MLITMLGLQTVNPLAKPKLEALRQAAVHLWRSEGRIDYRQLDTLVAAGYPLGRIAAPCVMTRPHRGGVRAGAPCVAA